MTRSRINDHPLRGGGRAIVGKMSIEMTKKVLEVKSKRSRATKFTLDSVIYLCLHFTKYNKEAKLTNELVNGHVSSKKSLTVGEGHEG